MLCVKCPPTQAYPALLFQCHVTHGVELPSMLDRRCILVGDFGSSCWARESSIWVPKDHGKGLGVKCDKSCSYSQRLSLGKKISPLINWSVWNPVHTTISVHFIHPFGNKLLIFLFRFHHHPYLLIIFAHYCLGWTVQFFWWNINQNLCIAPQLWYVQQLKTTLTIAEKGLFNIHLFNKYWICSDSTCH